VANPNVKIRIDPRSWKDSAGLRNFASGSNGLRSRQSLKIGICLNAAVKFTKKFPAVARVVFPGVLAIEKKTDGYRVFALHALANGAQAGVKVGGTGFGVHPAVNKTDQIGNAVITEE